MLNFNCVNILKREGVFALPFKLFVVFIIILSLCGCTSKTYTPEIKSEFEARANVNFDGFTYSCKIIKTENAVTVQVLDTNASGLSMKYDGNILTLKTNEFEDSFTNEKTLPSNPAVALYEALFSLENAEVRVNESGYLFTGKVRAGEFELLLSRANDIKTISFSSAKLQFSFTY